MPRPGKPATGSTVKVDAKPSTKPATKSAVKPASKPSKKPTVKHVKKPATTSKKAEKTPLKIIPNKKLREKYPDWFAR